MLNMEQLIADLLKQYGWIGFAIAVLLFLFTNSSSTSLFIKLIDRFSKAKDTSPITEKKRFNLLKLTRPSEKGRRSTATIFNAVLLGFFVYSSYILINYNLENAAKVAANIGIFFSAFLLLNIWIRNKSKTILAIEGNSDDLFRTYQMMLFDMNMLILSFDAQNKEVVAYLNGNELTIKIDCPNGTENMVTFTCVRDFFGMVFYSKEYQRNIRKLIYEVCYPKYDRNT